MHSEPFESHGENNPELPTALQNAIDQTEIVIDQCLPRATSTDALTDTLLHQARATEAYINARLEVADEKQEKVSEIFATATEKSFQSIVRLAVTHDLPLAELDITGEEDHTEWLEDLVTASQEDGDAAVSISLELASRIMSIHQQNIQGLFVYASQKYNTGEEMLRLTSLQQEFRAIATEFEQAIHDYMQGSTAKDQLQFYTMTYATAARLLIEEILGEEDICNPKVVASAMKLTLSPFTQTLEDAAKQYFIQLDKSIFIYDQELDAFAKRVTSEGYLEPDDDLIETVCLWVAEKYKSSVMALIEHHHNTYKTPLLQDAGKGLVLAVGAGMLSLLLTRAVKIQKKS